ncbi:hypothetical protein EDD66_11440 [Mobilisporobacter senegalensis]|uniref:Alpha-L-rhamnosidase-like protein n=1 Tax=Mobilisporobacter senegalensis TaxID=1329262 RepID=A0A3N1X9M4_9FIRM|nr:hypothetical protein [Mobilisporobacter senegalensis]ROR23433.1 hypothetical protein EDD66_11440 [Mobilisporobacter senegalensis]
MKEEKIKFLSFWAINDSLNLNKMKCQLLEMYNCGLNGVVFQPRNYPGNPDYLSKKYMNILSELILYAKSLNMCFWIYDENGWPSGRAGGLVHKKYPEARCLYLIKTDEGIKISSKNEISSLDPYAGRLFLEFTYEEYRKGLTKNAFDYVEGFFSDEVGYLDGHGVSVSIGGVPWCENYSQVYEEKYKEKIEDSWELLFNDGAGCEEVRVRYWETLNELLVKSFYQPIHEWCACYGKKYTAHVKGEETPFFQISYSSSCYQILKNVSVPAVDALERYPGNGYYPRIASSIAKQFYNGESLCEAIGGSGWGLTPEDFTNYIKWLIRCGIQTFVLHLQQYQLDGEAIRDWPPSLPLHINWKDCFSQIIEEIRRWGKEFKKEEEKKPLFLIVAPTRGVMAGFKPQDSMEINEHDGTNVPNTLSGRISNEFIGFIQTCYEQQIRFDVTEEKIIEEYARVTPNGLNLGHMTYEKVILGNGCCWNNKEILDVIKNKDYLMARESLKQRDYRKNHKINHKKVSLSQSPWKYISNGENQLLLSFQNKKSKIFECSLKVKNEKDIKNLYINSSDMLESLHFNGIFLEPDKQSNRIIYHVPDELARTTSWNIEIKNEKDCQKQPFVYVRGDFLVLSETDYEIRRKREIITPGPFYLSGTKAKITNENFIKSGYPFLGTNITLRKEFSNTDILPAGSLRILGVYADLLKINIDGKCCFIYDKDWSIPLEIIPGQHVLEVTCYPSTYNTYGPHHYLGGDYKVISPDQYKGVKNFADPSHFPTKTLSDNYSFVRFGIEKDLAAYIQIK